MSCRDFDSVLNIAIDIAMPSALLASLGPPFLEATYTNPEAVKAALQAHFRVNGYGVSVDSFNDHSVLYRYAKGGKYDDLCKGPDMHET